MSNIKYRDITHLHAGELFFGRNKKTIETLLGSCVSITLWHPEQRYSGICHFALPRNIAESTGKPDARYAEDCMQLFASLANDRKLRLCDFEAKIFGGGNSMARFAEGDVPELPADEKQYVGDKNVAMAFKLLMDHKVRIIEADVGEFGYRKLSLEMQTGETKVSFTPFGAPKTLNRETL